MDPITQQAVLATAGAATADQALYVDDVFSTYVYDGTGSAQTITNGIDLSGEGGLVWFKRRDSGSNHGLVDTERTRSSVLMSNSDASSVTSISTADLTSFNSDGFSIGSTFQIDLNTNGSEMCSWTFRKAPGFFDVVTYTGNGTSGRTISHNLGSVPGMILLKQTSASARWFVYHRSTGNGNQLTLNATNAAYSTSAWNNTTPTSTVFTLNDGTIVNGNGKTYVAYLFAHDDQSFGTNGDESIIKCGSYTGNGGYQNIDIGFEAQWVLIKRSSADGDWGIFDIMRGAPGGDNIQANGSVRLRPNTTQAEGGSGVGVYSDGFILGDGSSEINTSEVTYIYMAIRRPHKPPTAGTDVFAVDSRGGTSPTPPTFYSGFPVDFVTRRDTYPASWNTRTRLRIDTKALDFTSESPEFTSNQPAVELDRNTGVGSNTGADTNNFAWMFRRAPGFLDVVVYTGSGSPSGSTISHNLGVVPELLIAKRLTTANGVWAVYSSVTGNGNYLRANTNHSSQSTSFWQSTTPTSTQFYVNNNNNVGNDANYYVALLFASLSGISKVGSYSGTGSNIDVDCGFTAGARFVLIKRTDSTGDWYVWDTTRGIVSGNDPYLLLNSTAAQVTNTDYIDPLNAGFTVTSSAPAALNTSGGTYLFLAIA